jgi:hypothetical protein
LSYNSDLMLSQVTPYVVRIIQAPTPETTVADVLIASISLIVVLMAAAVLLGAVLGALFVGLRILLPRNPFNGQTAEETGLGLHTLSQS